MSQAIVTPDATRQRAIGQIVLLAAGVLVLVLVSASSVILVNQARKDNAWVVHTVEVENQISTLLLQIRRAESAARERAFFAVDNAADRSESTFC